MSEHPYNRLTEDKFWKTAVQKKLRDDLFEKIWVPKFEINTKMKIITAGSCFAQHIGKWLQKNSFNWIESEKPAGMSNKEAMESGFGVFSFRTGNIYTPALLKQWVQLAYGDKSFSGEMVTQDEKYFDLFRPNIKKGGFDTSEELIADRRNLLSCMKKTFTEADVFIFTLGLTEAWENKDGAVYPMCPGTMVGHFDKHQHVFRNYTFHELNDDMTWIIRRLREENPKIKILLTVSPVPLTATASDEHVLSATIQSKSKLRALAGDLKRNYSYVDYFPSYELISSLATKNNYFEDNLRSVSAAGVEFVMKHFEKAVSSSFKANSNIKKFQDEVCEDIFLESFSSGEPDQQSEVCLLGDSHMGKLSLAMDRMGLPHHGGMIMNGSAWTSNLIILDDDEFFVPLENKAARDKWQKTLPFFDGNSKGKIVFTNLGMQTHRSVSFYANYAQEKQHSFFDKEFFTQYFIENNKVKLFLLKRLQSEGYRVAVISDPPTRGLDEAVNKQIEAWNFYDKQTLEIMDAYGFDIFNASDYFQNLPKQQYYSDVVYADGTKDWFHGSDKYYEDLASVLSSYVDHLKEEKRETG